MWIHGNFIKNLSQQNSYQETINEDCIQIELTQEAKESNINDDFNKQIVIYRNGKRIRIIDFSIEYLIALKTVHPELPVYEEKFGNDYEMMEEEYFGEVMSR